MFDNLVVSSIEISSMPFTDADHTKIESKIQVW